MTAALILEKRPDDSCMDGFEKSQREALGSPAHGVFQVEDGLTFSWCGWEVNAASGCDVMTPVREVLSLSERKR